MAFIHGSSSAITVNSVDLSAFTNKCDFEHKADTHDVTCFGDSGHEYAAGLTDGTVTLGGVYDSSGTGTPRAVLTALVGAAPVAVLWHPEGTGTGKEQASFNAIVESYKESSPVADMVQWEASLKISGDVTYADQS